MIPLMIYLLLFAAAFADDNVYQRQSPRSTVRRITNEPSSVFQIEFNDEKLNNKPNSNIVYNFQQIKRDGQTQVDAREESVGKYMHSRRRTTPMPAYIGGDAETTHKRRKVPQSRVRQYSDSSTMLPPPLPMPEWLEEPFDTTLRTMAHPSTQQNMKRQRRPLPRVPPTEAVWAEPLISQETHRGREKSGFNQEFPATNMDMPKNNFDSYSAEIVLYGETIPNSDAPTINQYSTFENLHQKAYGSNSGLILEEKKETPLLPGSAASYMQSTLISEAAVTTQKPNQRVVQSDRKPHFRQGGSRRGSHKFNIDDIKNELPQERSRTESGPNNYFESKYTPRNEPYNNFENKENQKQITLKPKHILAPRKQISEDYIPQRSALVTTTESDMFAEFESEFSSLPQQRFSENNVYNSATQSSLQNFEPNESQYSTNPQSFPAIESNFELQKAQSNINQIPTYTPRNQPQYESRNENTPKHQLQYSPRSESQFGVPNRSQHTSNHALQLLHRQKISPHLTTTTEVPKTWSPPPPVPTLTPWLDGF